MSNPETPQADAAETRTVHDPFLGVEAKVSDRLVDRLRGKYACGPTLPNGEPEFGWRQHETVPIQHEAAARIEAQEAEIERLSAELQAAKEALLLCLTHDDVSFGPYARSDGTLERVQALSASPATIPARATSRTAEEVCHNDQLVVWAEELLYALECWIEAPESYDDVVQCGQAAKEEIKRIVECAFELAASPSPDTENGK